MYIVHNYRLSGLSPFGGNDDETTFQNITSCNIDFDDPVWKDVSREAKDWISKLIRLDPKWVLLWGSLVSFNNCNYMANRHTSSNALWIIALHDSDYVSYNRLNEWIKH